MNGITSTRIVRGLPLNLQGESVRNYFYQKYSSNPPPPPGDGGPLTTMVWALKEFKTKLFTYIQDIPKYMYIHFHKNIKVITKMS